MFTGVLQVTLDSRFREPANSYLHEAVNQSFHKDVFTVSCIVMFTSFKSLGASTTQQSDWVYPGSDVNWMKRVSEAMIFNLLGQPPSRLSPNQFRRSVPESVVDNSAVTLLAVDW